MNHLLLLILLTEVTVEWWYTDFEHSINIKIYPMFPIVRPTVLRFITNVPVNSKNANETDILDASVLLRNANIDDSGIYRCVIRPWTAKLMKNRQDDDIDAYKEAPTLTYHLELNGETEY